ncbi:proton-conducting transporter membrane subunit [Paenibacillus yanchengensis]|uniref:Proton-conducting transporter membrane subunit n=1 Tax=Paenibacillus yanchengensis TaxID=2035833 RepID=A0ABW4YMZ7_9BACL
MSLGVTLMHYVSIASQLTIMQSIAFLAVIVLLGGCWMQWRQRNIWKLLASAALIHVGFLLAAISVGAASLTDGFWKVILYYMVALILALIGMWIVAYHIQKTAGHTDLRGFAGLYYRAPAVLVAVTLLLLSLAGLPITPLFWGRLFVIMAMTQAEAYWLIAVSLVAVLLSFRTYFSFFKQMFMRSGGAIGYTNKQQWQRSKQSELTNSIAEIEKSDANGSIAIPVAAQVALWLTVALTLLLAVYPGLLF